MWVLPRRTLGPTAADLCPALFLPKEEDGVPLTACWKWPPLRLTHLKFSVLLISQSNECFWSRHNLQTGHETKKKEEKNPSMLATLKARTEESSSTCTFLSRGIHYSVGKRMASWTSWCMYLFPCLWAALTCLRSGLDWGTLQFAIRCGLPLASLLSASGRQKQAAVHGAKELWVAVWEHLEEEGFFARHKLRWSFLAQKEKVWLSLLKGFFVWQSHALFASAPITVRSGKMSCSYPSSIPDD